MSHVKTTILVVDDEPQLGKILKITLEKTGYKCIMVEQGRQAIRMVASVKPDLVLLDLGLPDMDGKEIIKAIREWSQVPIIVCSVRSDDDEVIEALELGADDYVTKPFNPAVLSGRIAANLRKSIAQEAGSPVIENGRVVMDLVRHEVLVEGQKIAFTPKEYELLQYMIVNRGKMLTHKEILQSVWGPAHHGDLQYLRVYISQLRDKIEPNPACPQYIATETGVGYRMEVVRGNIAQST